MNNDWCGVANFTRKIAWNETCFPSTLESVLKLEQVEVRQRTHPYSAGPFVYTNKEYSVLFSGKPLLNLPLSSEAHGKELIQRYQKHGAAFTENLTGHFSLVLIDATKKTVLLCIDRFGVGSLAYGVIDNTLHFSTSLNAYTDGNNQKLPLSDDAIFLFFDFNMIPPPWSIYKDVKKIKPGHFIYYRNNNLECTPYYQLNYTADNNADEPRLVEIFNTNLTNSFDELLSDLPNQSTGSTLSGGVDSSTMVGFLTSRQKGPVKTFSIGFNEEECNELPYARITAKHFNAEAYEYIVQPDDLFEVINKVVDTFGEPYGNSSAIPTYFCGKLAHDHGIKTLISGDGGDELFGGNERYLTNKIFNQYASIPKLLRAIIEVPAQHINTSNTFIKRVQNFIYRANLKNPERFFSDDSFGSKYPKELYTENFLEQVNNNISLQHMHGLYDNAKASTELNKLLCVDMFDTLAGNDIPKVRTMFKAAKVSPVFPMLHPDMVEFALSLPENFKLNGQQKRYLQKKAVLGFIPDAIQTKPKQGFGLPVGRWLREQPKIKDFFHDHLFSSSLVSRGILNQTFIKKLASDHQAGTWDNSFYLWSIMIFELWMKKHIDQKTI